MDHKMFGNVFGAFVKPCPVQRINLVQVSVPVFRWEELTSAGNPEIWARMDQESQQYDLESLAQETPAYAPHIPNAAPMVTSTYVRRMATSLSRFGSYTPGTFPVSDLGFFWSSSIPKQGD
jgi:hypothetical protein